jgi:hypothetical protein
MQLDEGCDVLERHVADTMLQQIWVVEKWFLGDGFRWLTICVTSTLKSDSHSVTKLGTNAAAVEVATGSMPQTVAPTHNSALYTTDSHHKLTCGSHHATSNIVSQQCSARRCCRKSPAHFTMPSLLKDKTTCRISHPACQT